MILQTIGEKQFLLKVKQANNFKANDIKEIC